MIANINKPKWMPTETWGEFVHKHQNDSLEVPCVMCGSTEDMTVDHIVPRIQQGGDDIRNLQPLCRVCNSRKGGRPDKHWSKKHYFDTPLHMEKLYVSQNDFVYQVIMEYRDFFTRPWSEINRKLFLYAQIVGAGKTLGMFGLPFALNEIAEPNAPRVDRMIIMTKDQALRAQIAEELRTEPVKFGIVDKAPEVVEITRGATLLNLPPHDIAVMCPHMSWVNKDGEHLDENDVPLTQYEDWTEQSKAVVNNYDLIIYDEVHYAYPNIAALIRVATQSLVFGFTASPIDGAGELLEDMVRMSVYGFSDANENDNSMKYIGEG